MKIIMSVVAVAVLLSIPTSTSTSGAVCHPVEVMEKLLENKFKQQPVVVGYVSGETTFRLYVSEEDLTWTVVLFTSNNAACAVVAGTDLSVIKETTSLSLPPDAVKLFRELVLGRDA